MATKKERRTTKIAWCHHTVNFWWGCEKESPACAHCYAEGIAKRFARGRATWGKDGLRWIRTDAAVKELKRLDKSARKRGVRERVFINSMSDTFEDRSDLHAPRNMLFVVAEKLTNLDLILLTKRPENVVPMLEKIRKHWIADKLPLFPHVWIGATVENQEMADKRVPELLRIPANVLFLSIEPMLESVNLKETNGYWGGIGISWVICGGESGVKARPLHPEWARSLRDQCKSAGVPFFMKQMGGTRKSLMPAIPSDLMIREVPQC